MKVKVRDALYGAFIGAMIASCIWGWSGEESWTFIIISAILFAVAGIVFGKPLIKWIDESLWGK